MLTLIFQSPKYDFYSLMVLAGMFLGIIGVVYLIILFKKHILHGKYYKAERAKIEPICIWEYSASEWQKYSKIHGLGKNPKGAATVKITPLDLWFIDENEKRRSPIDSTGMCVADCRFSNNSLKIRVRWAMGLDSTQYFSRDFQLPVPVLNTQDALRVEEFFKENIAQNTKKLLSVTPPELLTGLFGETDF